MRLYPGAMSRGMILLLAVLGLPYGYLAVYWTVAITTRGPFTGNMLFFSLVALAALPFVLAFIGGALALGGARQTAAAAAAGVAGSAVPHVAADAVRGGARLWIGWSVLTAAVPACIALLFLVFDTPEEGRDRLGRICESDGSSTTCRPDPDAKWPSDLDRANRVLERRRWFEKD